MNRLAIGVVVALVCLSANAATAQTTLQKTVSPPFPTDVGTDGACYVRNSGGSAMTVNVTIHSNNGTVVQFDNCNTGPLAPGRTCQVRTQLPDDSFAACIATAPNVGKLRGTFEVRETPSLVNPALRTLVAGDLVKK
jgi:hypothetical protein